MESPEQHEYPPMEQNNKQTTTQPEKKKLQLKITVVTQEKKIAPASMPV